jgi:2-methylcitrate dehydratase PrpD
MTGMARTAVRSLTEELATFAVAEMTAAPAVRAHAVRMLLDNLACQISGAALPWSRGFRDATRALGGGSGASVVYFGDAASLDDAAFLNGAFGHANEFDDTHLASGTHPGSVIVPAVLAMAEHRHAGGRATIDALIAGVEIMLRIGLAGAPNLYGRGHYVPCAVGPFGAAAACARLLGLDAVATLHAMGIAGSHAGGLKEFKHGGGSVKRIHCAIPSMSGLRSAVMAANGITGPPAILEGEHGLLAVFAGTYDASLLTAELGSAYRLLGVAFKPFACNLSMHAVVEALDGLQREHGFTATAVDWIDVGVSSSALRDVGAIVEPIDVLGAQTSIAFGSAVRLLRGGNGPGNYRAADLHDERFLALARRVRVAVDPVCDEERWRLENRGAIVTVRTYDGQTLERRVRFPKGSPEQPMTDDELRAKFTAAVTPVLGADRGAALVERIRHVEELDDVAALLPMTFAAGAHA